MKEPNKITDFLEVEKQIFELKNEEDFSALSLKVWQLQYENNALYKQYCDLVKRNNPQKIEDIAFLPISFFKQRQVKTTDFEAEEIFKSSGTTGSINSQHFVKKGSLYRDSFRKCFTQFYGNAKEYDFYALLPNYLEKGDSSLVFMAADLMKSANKSGFFLNQYDELKTAVKESLLQNRKVILLGVSFALMDFADFVNGSLPNIQNLIVIETGGMKGKRKELIREELHTYLQERFGVSHIHSEYGMTELLSQGYSAKNGIYNSPNWMKACIGDPYEPLSVKKQGEGTLKIIDLANLYSCSFLATQDIGKVHHDGSFEVIGRFDYSDVRGCNLMVG